MSDIHHFAVLRAVAVTDPIARRLPGEPLTDSLFICPPDNEAELEMLRDLIRMGFQDEREPPRQVGDETEST